VREPGEGVPVARVADVEHPGEGLGLPADN
jgi:hypothetical protein